MLPSSRPTAGTWLAMLFLIGPLATVLSIRIMGTLPILAAGLVAGTALVRLRRLPPIDPMAAAGLGSVLVLCLLSTIWAPHDGYLVGRLVKLLVLFLSALILYSAAADLAPAERAGCARALLIGAGIGLVAVGIEVTTDSLLYRMMTGTPLDAVEIYRVNRPLVILALLFWPAAAVLARQGAQGIAAAVVAYVALLAIAATSTSQSAPLALLVGAAVWLLARWVPRAAVLAVAAGIVLAVALAPWAGPLFDRLETVTGLAPLQAAAVAERLEIWQRSAEIAARHPFLGIGLEGLRVEAVAGDTAGAIGRFEGANHPHNAALQIRLEFGVLGLILATALTAALALRMLAASDRSLMVAVPTLATMAAVALVSHGLWQSWWIGAIGVTAAGVRAIIELGPPVGPAPGRGPLAAADGRSPTVSGPAARRPYDAPAGGVRPSGGGVRQSASGGPTGLVRGAAMGYLGMLPVRSLSDAAHRSCRHP